MTRNLTRPELGKKKKKTRALRVKRCIRPRDRHTRRAGWACEWGRGNDLALNRAAATSDFSPYNRFRRRHGDNEGGLKEK